MYKKQIQIIIEIILNLTHFNKWSSLSSKMTIPNTAQNMLTPTDKTI